VELCRRHSVGSGQKRRSERSGTGGVDEPAGRSSAGDAGDAARLSESSATAGGKATRALHELEDHDDPLQARLFAALDFATEALPAEWQPLLVPLALHERFVQAEVLELMAQQADNRFDRAAIDRFMNTLEIAGLLRAVGQGCTNCTRR